ncbi:MAG: carbohydrate porin [Marinoscillum sp.]
MKRLLYFIYLLSAIHFCLAQNADKSLIEYELGGKRYKTEFPIAKKAETVLELTYSFPFRKWLTIQPDLQYVINPGTGSTLKNPLAIALLVQASVGGAW